MRKILFALLLFLFSHTLHSQTSGWFFQNSGTSNELRGVCFRNSQTGWAAGYYNTILKTTNGGDNWFLSNSGIVHSLITLKFINDYTGWAVGGSLTGVLNCIYKSTNAGQNWFLQHYSDTIGCGLNLSFINSNTGWVACGNGYILKTTNSGNNWIILNIGSNKHVSTCHFFNANTGWIVGEVGIIMKTTNGGLNWQAKNSGTTINLSGLNFVNRTVAYASGLNGTMLKTTDGGENWVTQYTGITDWLVNIKFTSINTGYTAGGFAYGAGKIMKTTNGGINWFTPPAPSTRWLTDVTFVNSKTGYIVGKYGVILKTTNGGVPFLLPPELESPLNNSVDIPLTPDMKWSISSGATHYKIMISTASYFYPVTDSATVTDTQYTVPSGKLTEGKKYYWRIRAIDDYSQSNWSDVWNFTTLFTTGVKQNSAEIPTEYKLYQNYPNPFNPVTKIKFDIPLHLSFPNASIGNPLVVLKIYDALGREVAILMNESLTAGRYEITFDGSNLSSGIYFYKFESDDFSDMKRMILLK